MEMYQAMREMRGQITLVREMAGTVLMDFSDRMGGKPLFTDSKDLERIARGVKNLSDELEYLKRLNDAAADSSTAA